MASEEGSESEPKQVIIPGENSKLDSKEDGMKQYELSYKN